MGDYSASSSAAAGEPRSVEIVENRALKRLIFLAMLVLPAAFLFLTYFKVRDSWSHPATRTLFAAGACLLGYMAYRIVSQLARLRAVKAAISGEEIVFSDGPTLWGKEAWTESQRLRLDRSVKLMGKRRSALFSGCVIVAYKKDVWFLSSSWFKGINKAITYFESEGMKYEPLRPADIKKYRTAMRDRAAGKR